MHPGSHQQGLRSGEETFKDLLSRSHDHFYHLEFYKLELHSYFTRRTEPGATFNVHMYAILGEESGLRGDSLQKCEATSSTSFSLFETMDELSKYFSVNSMALIVCFD